MSEEKPKFSSGDQVEVTFCGVIYRRTIVAVDRDCYRYAEGTVDYIDFVDRHGVKVDNPP